MLSLPQARSLVVVWGLCYSLQADIFERSGAILDANPLDPRDVIARRSQGVEHTNCVERRSRRFRRAILARVMIDNPTLGSRLKQILDQKLTDAEKAASAFEQSLSVGDLAPLSLEALELEVTSNRGIHIDIPNCDCRVRFAWGSAVEPTPVAVHIVNSWFESVAGPFAWRDGDDALNLSTFIARELQRRGELPKNFAPESVLKELARLLCKLVGMRAGKGGTRDLSPAIYVPNPAWAVTDHGVESMTQSYVIERSRLRETDWVQHISAKKWTSYDEVEPAFDAARRIFGLLRKRGSRSTPEFSARSEESAGIPNPGRAQRIFLASSAEALGIAKALQEALEHDAQPTVWTQDVFAPSEYVLESLQRQADTSDYGVFIFSPDDVLRMRGIETPQARDNVVFELGLFIGALGRERCFVVQPRTIKMHLPSDLLGLTSITYDDDREDGNLIAALAPVGNKILRAVSTRSGTKQTANPDAPE